MVFIQMIITNTKNLVMVLGPLHSISFDANGGRIQRKKMRQK